jgi:ATP-binding cassette, subfamily B, bacterial
VAKWGVNSEPPPSPGKEAPDGAERPAAGKGRRFDINDVLSPVVHTNARDLPRLVTGAVRLVWGAAKRELVLTLFLEAVSSAGMAAQVVVARYVLAAFIKTGAGGGVHELVLPLVGFAVATAVVSTANSAGQELQRVLSELVGRYAGGQVLDVAVAADLLAFETPQFHDRLQRAQVNATFRPLQMTTGLVSVAQGLFGTLAVGAVLLFIQPLFLVLVVAAYLPVWVAVQRAGGASYKNFVEMTEMDRRRTYIASVLTRKEQAKEVRTFDLAGFFRERWEELYAWRVGRVRALAAKRTRYGVAGNTAMSVMLAGAVAVLAWLVSSHRLSLAGAGAAAGALLLIGNQLQGLSSGASSLFESTLFIEDFNSFVRSMPKMLTRSRGGGQSPPESFEALKAEDVWFTYPSRQVASLSGVSIEVRKGEVVALVGENGSGKTTLAKVLAGLYEAERGNVLLDSMEVGRFDRRLWLEKVAVLFQDYVHYFLSVKENITTGRWQRWADLDALHAAAYRSGADKVVASLPEAYETKLGPEFAGGVDLSGGEWQRVALARAFFRDAEIIILDEPTASLDPRSEAELFASVRSLFQGRTTLLISHRFSSVRSADRIYVLAGGKVVESGTHEQLMRAGGLYNELFSVQAAALLGDELTGTHGPASPSDRPAHHHPTDGSFGPAGGN